MLVLSRNEMEKVLFPTLGISVEVLRIRGRTARLGIDAPAEIPVLRHELAGRRTVELTPDGRAVRDQLGSLTRAVRQCLDRATETLNRLHEKLDEGAVPAAQQIVLRLFRDLQALETSANRAVEWSSSAKALQVLLVEDSEMERKLLASVLELSGLAVTTAMDGQDALEFLSLHAKPDAVLLDMVMPRCDGPNFVRQVRSNPKMKDLKIFAVSGTAPSTLGLATGRGGIDGWFPKPFDPAELVSALDEQLSICSMR